MPTNGFSTKPLKVKLLAGQQKATEFIYVSQANLSDGRTELSLQLRARMHPLHFCQRWPVLIGDLAFATCEFRVVQTGLGYPSLVFGCPKQYMDRVLSANQTALFV